MRLPRSLALIPRALMPLVLLAACGGSDAPPAPVTYASRCGLPDSAAEPYRTGAPTGPHCVGAAEYLVKDDTRAETLGGIPGDRRSVQVRVLYPASARSSGVRMPYAGEAVYAQMEWLPATLRAQGHAWREAVPGVDQPAPVILFSPGLGANVEVYAGLTEELASHGYVVVAINHPYVSGVTPLPDGRLAHYDKAQDEGDGEYDDEDLAADWARGTARIAVTMADEGVVLDWLARQNATPGGLLAGRLDMARIGAFGHSFGGATALQLLRRDSRVKAAVNIDGTVYGDLRQPWTKPFMLLQSVIVIEGQRREEETMKTVWETRQGPGQREVLEGACHGDFGDAHRLVNLYNARHPAAHVELPADLFCTTDAEGVERTVRARLLDFFGRYLR